MTILAGCCAVRRYCNPGCVTACSEVSDVSHRTRRQSRQDEEDGRGRRRGGDGDEDGPAGACEDAGCDFDFWTVTPRSYEYVPQIATGLLGPEYSSLLGATPSVWRSRCGASRGNNAEANQRSASEVGRRDVSNYSSCQKVNVYFEVYLCARSRSIGQSMTQPIDEYPP